MIKRHNSSRVQTNPSTNDKQLQRQQQQQQATRIVELIDFFLALACGDDQFGASNQISTHTEDAQVWPSDDKLFR